MARRSARRLAFEETVNLYLSAWRKACRIRSPKARNNHALDMISRNAGKELLSGPPRDINEEDVGGSIKRAILASNIETWRALDGAVLSMGALPSSAKMLEEVFAEFDGELLPAGFDEDDFRFALVRSPLAELHFDNKELDALELVSLFVATIEAMQAAEEV